jgi:hypothetical protein
MYFTVVFIVVMCWSCPGSYRVVSLVIYENSKKKEVSQVTQKDSERKLELI